MASKGQKFIKYTDEFINEIVDQMNKGVTAYHLTKVNNISFLQVNINCLQPRFLVFLFLAIVIPCYLFVPIIEPLHYTVARRLVAFYSFPGHYPCECIFS